MDYTAGRNGGNGNSKIAFLFVANPIVEKWDKEYFASQDNTKLNTFVLILMNEFMFLRVAHNYFSLSDVYACEK